MGSKPAVEGMLTILHGPKVLYLSQRKFQSVSRKPAHTSGPGSKSEHFNESNAIP
jgi:hypothetical protein